MAGYRSAFIQGGKSVARALPLSALLQASGQRLFLPFYHLVSDAPEPHLRHLYPVRTVRQFWEDIRYFKAHFQPLRTQDLQKLVRSGKLPSRPAFLLSFDDGFRACAEVVAPILKAEGLTALFFLNPAFLDNRALFFRCKASLLIEQVRRDGHAEQAAREWLAAQGRAGESVSELLLSISYGRQHLLDELAALLKVSFREFLDRQKPYLSVDQVRQLQAQGFQLGAHSMDHPLYAELPLEEQLRQTRDSLAVLREQFGTAGRYFAFPFTDHGVPAAFFQRMQGALDLSFGGAGLKRDVVPQHLQRIPMEMGPLSAREIVQGELLYHLARKPFGKNQIRRA